MNYATSAKAATAPTLRLSWAPQQHDVDAAAAAAARARTAVVFVDDADINTAAGDVGTLGPVDDPQRLDGVRRLGVDETAFLAANAYHSTSFITGVVDLTGRVARLLDVVDGRSGKAL